MKLLHKAAPLSHRIHYSSWRSVYVFSSRTCCLWSWPPGSFLTVASNWGLWRSNAACHFCIEWMKTLRHASWIRPMLFIPFWEVDEPADWDSGMWSEKPCSGSWTFRSQSINSKMERIKLFLEKKKYWNLNQIIKEPKEINYAASEK